ncbi:ATP-binding cassette domain-containing protein [Streptantibioticus silvisoli]|uniref:ATP-binding cassette domain-containing protein n=1 Tax=Streptantibioticus silvisoli TaxID=2705255 RepID=A0ABT6W066_9ACTN|nr:ATP-binding cassette domain-containing protein [Streptantibioticus silvisoli]MDI5964137.1 ATP-binding cassette domain-containing protein [Streptantibioticus silvisoli]
MNAVPASSASSASSATVVRPAIAAAGMSKSYGDTTVLDGIDLTVPEGTVFALLGPNGAGKTTTVQILSTLIAPTAGEARIAGHDLVREAGAVRSVIGVTGQFSAVDNLLTAEENLLLMADLHHLDRREGRRRATALLSRFELAESTAKPVATYSGGMRRKLDLAMTLMGRPRVIFLDEPTTGLDPRSRRIMWEIIRGLVVDDGVTILLTTQYLEEADQLADRIALLDHGRIVAEGTAEELKRRIPGGHVRLRFADAAQLARAASLFGSVATGHPDNLTLNVPSDGGITTLRAVLDTLDAASLGAEALTVHTPDLDDVFLALTGRPQLTSPPTSPLTSPKGQAR